MIVTGNTYLLIIGIEDYLIPKEFKRVRYGNKDANDIATAFVQAGISTDNVKVLLNEEATKTIILKELSSICKIVKSNDRIIFFYAGHGAFSEATNWIVPADAYKSDIKGTCISIKDILGQLKDSECNKSIVFLDSCHSGFEPGEAERETSTNFIVEDLLYYYKDEEYCYGFSSAKKDEISVSSDILNNGVWTSHLVKAINGDGPQSIYENGILFNDKLQSYLNKEVNEFVKLNTEKKTEQTPTTFGRQTDRFPIADLTSIFQAKDSKIAYSGISFESVSMLTIETDQIKTLSGFRTGSHTVPKDIYSGADSFINSISESEIKDEITQITKRISEIGYKRKQVESIFENGQGSISTPDFLYSVTISQNESNPSEYKITRLLEGFQNSEIIQNDIFNDIFSKHFEELNFQVSTDINIEELIDKVEGLEDESITVDFDHTDTTWCKLVLEGLEYQVYVDKHSIAITYYRRTSPKGLSEAFQQTYEKLSQTKELKLLG